MESPRVWEADSLTVKAYADQAAMAMGVAQEVAAYFCETIAAKGSLRAILATGNSQIEFLEKLQEVGGVDWSKVTLFHMDEYMGIDADHSASFCRYLRERVEQRLRPKAFHYIRGDADLPLDECDRYQGLLEEASIDACCLGIGENGHLAFNDPHVAQFTDARSIKLVRLAEACRLQQVNEGHFPNLAGVPPFAYTLTIPALCSARRMFCVAPEARKATAVARALEGPVDVSCPASFLRTQAHATLYLDADSASELNP